MSSEEDYSHFYHCIGKNAGHINSQIKIDHSQDERCLFTRNTIEPYTALAIIPCALVANKQHPHLPVMSAETQRLRLILFLLHEYIKKDDSNWFLWLHLLKIDEQAKEFFNMQMKIFDCVEDSTLGQALTARYQQLQEEYHQLCQSKMIDCSFELFCTIDHLVWSRVLHLPENEPLSLAPLIDFANHRYVNSYLSMIDRSLIHPNACWFIDDDKHNLILRSEQRLSVGEEMTISYGSKSNEELLYLYGFALIDNPNDRVTLPVSLSPDDPLFEEKFRLIEEFQLAVRLTLVSYGI